ncbi:MAG: hypothetical protein QXW79_00890 [Thermoplasmata archaeon]
MTDETNKYHPRIYQLDELIVDLYNMVYANSDKYKIKFIDISDLKKERFKLSTYDLDIIFYNVPVKYAGKFPTGIKNVEQIHFKRQGELYMSTIRIIPYKNREAINDMTDPVNVNQIIKTLLSELVVSGKTDNILLPIINIDVRGLDLMEYENIAPYISKDQYYSIQITEKYYSLTTLENFLKENPLGQDVIKSIIYQAVDVLYQITSIYPKFRCNQFFPEMIDCYLKKNNETIYPKLKLSNFFLAEIDEIVPNNFFIKNQNKIPRLDTPYGDLYQLLNYLWNYHYIEISKYPELVSLFDTILPIEIRSSKEKYLTPNMWEKLDKNKKNELEIRNIRNNKSFTQDPLLRTMFIESKNISPTNVEKKESRKSDNIGVTIISPQNDPVITSEEEVDLSDINIPIVKKSNDSNESKDKSSKIESKPIKKKYSSDDIDIMSDKHSNKYTKQRKEKISEEVESTEVPSEDIRHSKQSRIVNISDSKLSDRGTVKPKIKTYHGRRYINLNYLSDRNIGSNPVPMNQFAQNTSLPSRINSIGAMLGANPSDYTNPPIPNYSQIAQQLSQQYHPELTYPPGQIPPNQSTQIPFPIQNPVSLGSVQGSQIQSEIDPMTRYILASNQLQNQYAHNLVNGQVQMDTSTMVPIMPQNQPTIQNPMLINPQIGGNKKNFFFQKT